MTNEDKKNVLTILGIPMLFVFMIIAFLPLGLFNAWALQKMYGWFLIPLGLPALNLWHVWGIMMIINHIKPMQTDDTKLWISIAKGVYATCLMLLIGYLLKGHI